jgi:hypothetical protein
VYATLLPFGQTVRIHGERRKGSIRYLSRQLAGTTRLSPCAPTRLPVPSWKDSMKRNRSIATLCVCARSPTAAGVSTRQ